DLLLLRQRQEERGEVARVAAPLERHRDAALAGLRGAARTPRRTTTPLAGARGRSGRRSLRGLRRTPRAPTPCGGATPSPARGGGAAASTSGGGGRGSRRCARGRRCGGRRGLHRLARLRSLSPGASRAAPGLRLLRPKARDVGRPEPDPEALGHGVDHLL